MKIKSILFAALSLFAANSYAQCSAEKNNFEIMLSQSSSNKLEISIRHNVEKEAYSVVPNSQIKLDGLILALSWPSTSSSIHIKSIHTALKPFNLKIDEAANVSNTNARQIQSIDKFATFYNDGPLEPQAFEGEWANGEWQTLATVEYEGQLNTNDMFALLNCDYGLANPNSYYGNSHTDPWFSMFNNSGDYLQYSPKIINQVKSNLVAQTKFSVYPNPAREDLNIEIESAIATQVAVLIYDITGKVVKNITYKIEKGSNNSVVNISDLSQGSYAVKITDGKAINYSTQISKI